jgi:hypothetical protein
MTDLRGVYGSELSSARVYGHVAAFTVTPPGGVPTGVHTHAVVIQTPAIDW